MRPKLALTSIVAAVAISSTVSAQPRSVLAIDSSAVAGAGQTVQESTDANQGLTSSQEVDATLTAAPNSQEDSEPAVNQTESADNASTEPDQNTPGTSEQPAVPAKNGWESTASGWVFWVDGEQAHGIVSVEGKSYFLDAKTKRSRAGTMPSLQGRSPRAGAISKVRGTGSIPRPSKWRPE